MDREIAAFDALAKHPRLDALSALVGDECRTVVNAKRWDGWPASFEARVKALDLGEAEAKTELGDLRDVLRRGPENDNEAMLVRALAGHALAATPPMSAEDQTRAAEALTWLTAHTPLGAISLVDRALDEELAEGLWGAIATRVRRSDTGATPRGEAIVGAAALAASSAAMARKLTARLRREAHDTWVKQALGRDDSATLDGELGVAPRSPLATTLLAITGLLFVVSMARLFARIALAMKRPATVRIAPSGIEIETRTEMLGRTLREKRIRIDRTALVRAAREVRYPRLAFYAGLLALAIGSYLGVSFLIDGTRAASPTLLGIGLVVIAIGIAIDFFLSGLSPSVQGKCRLVLVPRRGPSVAIEGLEAGTTDRALETLRA